MTTISLATLWHYSCNGSSQKYPPLDSPWVQSSYKMHPLHFSFQKEDLDQLQLLFWEFHPVEAQLHLDALTLIQDDDKTAEKQNNAISFSQKVTTTCAGEQGMAIDSNSTYRHRVSYLTKPNKSWRCSYKMKIAETHMRNHMIGHGSNALFFHFSSHIISTLRIYSKKLTFA